MAAARLPVLLRSTVAHLRASAMARCVHAAQQTKFVMEISAHAACHSTSTKVRDECTSTKVRMRSKRVGALKNLTTFFNLLMPDLLQQVYVIARVDLLFYLGLLNNQKTHQLNTQPLIFRVYCVNLKLISELLLTLVEKVSIFQE